MKCSPQRVTLDRLYSGTYRRHETSDLSWQPGSQRQNLSLEPGGRHQNLSWQPGSRYLTRKTYHYSPAVHQKPIIVARQFIKTYHYSPAVHQKPIIVAR